MGSLNYLIVLSGLIPLKVPENVSKGGHFGSTPKLHQIAN